MKETSNELRWTICSYTSKTNPGFVNQSWGQHVTLQIVKGLIIGFIVLGQSCVIEDSSFVQIISCPAKFDGKEIEVTGIYHERFEDVAVYLERGSGREEAMWVDLSGSNERLDGTKVRVKGIFDLSSKGHLGQYIGTLRDAQIIGD